MQTICLTAFLRRAALTAAHRTVLTAAHRTVLTAAHRAVLTPGSGIFTQQGVAKSGLCAIVVIPHTLSVSAFAVRKGESI